MHAQMRRRRMSTGLSAPFLSVLGLAAGFAAAAGAGAAGTALSAGLPWFNSVIDLAQMNRAELYRMKKCGAAPYEANIFIYDGCTPVSSNSGWPGKKRSASLGQAGLWD